jgi:hypothetical protein
MDFKNLKNVLTLKNAGKAGKIALAFVVPTVVLAGYYVIDRKFIKGAPLFPFNLEKARKNQADDAMIKAESKLKSMMDEGKLNGFGVIQDPSSKLFYIEVASVNPTNELRSAIPLKVNNVQVRLVQRENSKTS